MDNNYSKIITTLDMPGEKLFLYTLFLVKTIPGKGKINKVRLQSGYKWSGHHNIL